MTTKWPSLFYLILFGFYKVCVCKLFTDCAFSPRCYNKVRVGKTKLKYMKIYQSCRICKAVYFNKSWHHGDRIGIDRIRKSTFVWTTRCPACKMVEQRQFAGQITLKNIPARTSRQLLRLISEYSRRAYEKDCQHRLIAVEKSDPSTWIVTTTENQLANRMAQKISQSFDHVIVKTAYPPERRSIAKVLVEFLPLFYHRFNPQSA